MHGYFSSKKDITEVGMRAAKVCLLLCSCGIGDAADPADRRSPDQNFYADKTVTATPMCGTPML